MAFLASNVLLTCLTGRRGEISKPTCFRRVSARAGHGLGNSSDRGYHERLVDDIDYDDCMKKHSQPPQDVWSCCCCGAVNLIDIAEQSTMPRLRTRSLLSLPLKPTTFPSTVLKSKVSVEKDSRLVKVVSNHTYFYSFLHVPYGPVAKLPPESALCANNRQAKLAKF